MFDYETSVSRRRLESFLNSEPKEVKPKHEEKITEDSFIRKTIDYFTGNSNIWYTYKFNEKTQDIEYSFPRTLLKDANAIKDYFVNLFNKNK
jgi:hypothetical protein